MPAGGHIPYRDSKLTRILQPSLGGNAKTAIICNLTPAAIHVEESHSTLRFATRARRVMNNAVVNEVLSDAAVLKRQAKEIEELKKQLQFTG
jgi:centromeric protein E